MIDVLRGRWQGHIIPVIPATEDLCAFDVTADSVADIVAGIVNEYRNSMGLPRVNPSERAMLAVLVAGSA